MSASYNILSSSSSIQVLSPTVVQPIVDCTIQTIPTGVILDYWVDQDTWDAGDAAPLLEAVAGDVEHLISATWAVSGVGSQSLDASGLLAQFVTFTVAYNDGAGPYGQVTADAVVPITLLGQGAIAGSDTGLTDAESIIHTVAEQLTAVVQG